MSLCKAMVGRIKIVVLAFATAALIIIINVLLAPVSRIRIICLTGCGLIMIRILFC